MEKSNIFFFEKVDLKTLSNLTNAEYFYIDILIIDDNFNLPLNLKEISISVCRYSKAKRIIKNQKETFLYYMNDIEELKRILKIPFGCELIYKKPFFLTTIPDDYTYLNNNNNDFNKNIINDTEYRDLKFTMELYLLKHIYKKYLQGYFVQFTESGLYYTPLDPNNRLVSFSSEP